MCGLLKRGQLAIAGFERDPLLVDGSASVLDVMERLRGSPVQMAIVTDDTGTVEGIVTPTDVLEAIVGELPPEGEKMPANRSPTPPPLGDSVPGRS
jgi:CBS domain containing-hemolysin-like protein